MASSKANTDLYDVFISYRQADARDTALSIYTMLHQRFKLRVFYDAQEIETLHDLADNVLRSKSVIAIMSQGYLDALLNTSSWCHIELRTAVQCGINIVPIYDPEKGAFPAQSYIDQLTPDLKSVFKILFRPIRREGEHLEVFYKDVLRSAGHEDAYIRAQPNPYGMLDCSPRCQRLFKHHAVRLDVARQLITKYGLSDIEDLKHIDGVMVDSLGLKPLEAAKLRELINMAQQGGSFEEFDYDPNDTRGLTGGLPGCRFGTLGRGTLGRSGASTSGMGGMMRSSVDSLRSLHSAAGSRSMRSAADAVDAGVEVVRLTSGDLNELAQRVADASGPLVFDLANRTFRSSALRGIVLNVTQPGITIVGGKIHLERRKQRIVVTAADTVFEDLTIGDLKAKAVSELEPVKSESEDEEDDEEEEEEDDDDEEEDDDEDDEEDEEDDEEEDEDEEDEEEEEQEAEEGEEDELGMASLTNGVVLAASQGTLEVRAGGDLVLRRCNLPGSKFRAAVLCTQGGKVELQDSDMSNAHHPQGSALIAAGASCSIYAVGCSMHHSRQPCVMLAGGAVAELRGCRMFGSKKRSGLDIQGYGTTAVLEQCDMCNNSSAGALAREGATLELVECALYASRTSSGLVVVGRSQVVAHKCELRGNTQNGAYIAEAGTLEARGCRFEGNEGESAEAEGPGSTLSHDSACTFKPGPPAASKRGAVRVLT